VNGQQVIERFRVVAGAHFGQFFFEETRFSKSSFVEILLVCEGLFIWRLFTIFAFRQGSFK
jgi:hypothetical protein